MNDPVYQELKELSWRRRLSPGEEAQLQLYLQHHPGVQNDWEVENALGRAFRQLPNVPVATNFTSRVLVAVETETRARSATSGRARSSWWRRIGWAPRTAAAAVTLFLTVISVRQYQITSRAEMAHSVARLSSVATLPPLQWLKDFDAINELRAVPSTDDDKLLTVLESKE